MYPLHIANAGIVGSSFLKPVEACGIPDKVIKSS
jgi:hypothetical protein